MSEVHYCVIRKDGKPVDELVDPTDQQMAKALEPRKLADDAFDPGRKFNVS